MQNQNQQQPTHNQQPFQQQAQNNYQNQQNQFQQQPPNQNTSHFENLLQPEEFNIALAVHPMICLIHLGLKLAPIFSYAFMSFILLSQVNAFIVTILIICADFWFVKNVAGRILIGMRWWNGEMEADKEGWFFESYNIEHATSSIDRHIFWWSMILSTLFWCILLVIKFLSLSIFWGMLVLIAFTLNAMNLYGYYLCRQDHQKKIKNLLKEFSTKYKPVYDIVRNSLRIVNNNNQIFNCLFNRVYKRVIYSRINF